MAIDYASILLGQKPEETDQEKLQRLAFELLGLLMKTQQQPEQPQEVLVADRVLPYTA